MLDHPLVPGPTSAVETGPWHYGADYISVYFKGSQSRLDQLVPRPFRVQDGSCIGYVCEIISVADSALDLVSTHPERTIYREAAVGVKCRFGEREGIFYPVMWVTSEWSLLRGILNGYQKRLADNISLTKLHPLNPGLKPVSPGTKFGGFCVKGSDKVLSLHVSVKKPGSPSDLPSFGATFGLRRFPRTEKTQAEVDEPVEILKSNSRVTDVWLGEGSLESDLDLGDVEPSSGAVYRSGFTISGSKVLRS